MPDPIQGVSTTTPIDAATTAPAGTTQASGPSTQPQASAPVDQADVGGTEALLTTIAQAASDVPSVDQARVTALQQAIAAGTFQVDPQKTAENMMQLEAGLASRGGGS